MGITHGQNEENALRYRDKIKMKRLLRDAGINVPEFSELESASDVVKFCEKHGYDVCIIIFFKKIQKNPNFSEIIKSKSLKTGTQVVIKPRKGYSSVNTWIIHDEFFFFG